MSSPWVSASAPLEDMDLPDLLRIHGTDVHPVPPEIGEAAAEAWAAVGTMLNEGITLLAKHKADSPDCPGPWCPGVRVEASLQQMERWQLEALLSVALHRLWEASRERR